MTVLRLVLIALALGVAAPPVRAAASPLVLVHEGEGGLIAEWEVGSTSGPTQVGIALPVGHVAAVELVGPGGAVAPPSAARITRSGWAAGAPYSDVALDPSGLEPGRWSLRVTFQPGRLPQGAPLDPDALALHLAQVRAGLKAPATWGPILNPATAETARARTAADRSLRPSVPRTLQPPPPGRALRARVLPRASSLGGATHAPGLPAGGASAQGFTSGRVKIVVGPGAPGGPGGTGIYRITHAALTAMGADLSDVPLADLRLLNRGARAPTEGVGGVVEIPLRTHDSDGDGLFGPDDWFEFFGEPLVGEAVPFAWHGADYTDENVYVLDSAPGTRARMATRDATPTSPATGDYLETLHLETNDLFFSTRTGEYNVDHYFWCSPQSLLWRNGDPPRRRVENAALDGLVSGSARRGAVRARLFHRLPDVAASPDHRSQLEVNGVVVSDLSGDGFEIVDHAADDIPAADLTASTQVALVNPGANGVDSRFELDWIEVDYPRATAARSGQLTFPHAGGSSATVTGLLGADVTVLDVSDPDAPVLLTGLAPTGSAVSFELAGPPEARWAVASHAGAPSLAPTRMEWMPDRGLRSQGNRGEVVVIGPAAWLEPPLPALQRWIADRQAQGLSVLLAPTEHVMDDMRLGIFTPVAIHDLLVVARSTWAERPDFVLLLGDTTIDYKNQLGGLNLSPTTCTPFPDDCGFDETAWVQHVPTIVYDVPGDQQFLGYFASDAIYALVEGDMPPPDNDWRPDLGIGRLPARTAAEVEALLDKVLAYEARAVVAEPWMERVAHVADQVRSGVEVAFESVQDSAFDRLIAPYYPRTTYYLESDYGGAANVEAMTADLKADWLSTADGSAVMSYIGHGAAYRWSGVDILLNRGSVVDGCRNDARDLDVPGAALPFILNVNCITGSFTFSLSPSLLEELVRDVDGGAIAAIGPTGITDLLHASTEVDAFYGTITGPNGRGRRVGEVSKAVVDALSGAEEALLSKALLGDPTARLVVPHGPPAIDLTATGADAAVDLTWPAVPGAATYAIWRSDVGANGPWFQIASGIAGTSHRDTGDPPGPLGAVVNGVPYWYVVEPVDVPGYPGRWSPVRTARPCTFDPPLPATNLRVTAGNCTGSATLTWTRSATPNLQAHVVRAYRGASATGIPEREQWAPGMFAVINGLVPFREYTFTVTPLTWCNVEGPPTPAVTVSSDCPLALDPPAFIPDLRVARAGNDVQLSWGAVTQTVMGTPATITEYVVHRATEPDFLAGAGSEVARPAGTSHVDAGRIGNGLLEFYAVAAVDSAGRSGSVGHDFPQGVRAFRTDLGADWEVVWTPSPYDIQGDETPIAAYEVYTAVGPLDRARIENEGLVPRTTVAAPPVVLPELPGENAVFVVPRDVHGNRSVN